MTGPGALALTGLVLLFAAVVAAVTATECRRGTYRETARPVAVAAFSLACLCWIVACWLEAIR